jgi:hypothetical protein
LCWRHAHADGKSGTAMNEDPTIIKMNVAHYRELLKLDLDDQKRSTVNQLLEEALQELAPKTNFKK